MPYVRVTVLRYFAVILLCAGTLLAASRRERYVLVLEDPPIAANLSSSKDLERAAAADRSRQILRTQASIRDALATKKIRVTGANHTLANVIFVEGDPARLQELKQLPGVARVERLTPLKLHLNEALELMNVTRAWGAVNGEQNAGDGVKIGILDTGIDHTHPAFKDDG